MAACRLPGRSNRKRTLTGAHRRGEQTNAVAVAVAAASANCSFRLVGRVPSGSNLPEAGVNVGERFRADITNAMVEQFGAPEEIRTPDPQIRSLANPSAQNRRSWH